MVALEVTPRHAIEQISQNLGLSLQEIAGALTASPKTVQRWKAGETYPQHEARERLALLLDLNHRLRETFDTPQAVQAWTHADNRYLGGLTPADAIRAGRVDRVEAALEALDSGIFL